MARQSASTAQSACSRSSRQPAAQGLQPGWRGAARTFHTQAGIDHQQCEALRRIHAVSRGSSNASAAQSSSPNGPCGEPEPAIVRPCPVNPASRNPSGPSAGRRHPCPYPEIRPFPRQRGARHTPAHPAASSASGSLRFESRRPRSRRRRDGRNTTRNPLRVRTPGGSRPGNERRAGRVTLGTAVGNPARGVAAARRCQASGSPAAGWTAFGPNAYPGRSRSLSGKLGPCSGISPGHTTGPNGCAGTPAAP